MKDLIQLRRDLTRLTNPAKAAFLQRFFKTGPGQYAEGDRFRGITVPELRKLRLVMPAYAVLRSGKNMEKR
jgi:hypothetical protein